MKKNLNIHTSFNQATSSNSTTPTTPTNQTINPISPPNIKLAYKESKNNPILHSVAVHPQQPMLSLALTLPPVLNTNNVNTIQSSANRP